MRRTTSITIDAGLWERARALAGMLGMSLSQLVELALRHLLGELPLLAAVLARLERLEALCGRQPSREQGRAAPQPPAAPEAPALPPEAPPALRGNVWVALLRKRGGGLQSP